MFLNSNRFAIRSSLTPLYYHTNTLDNTDLYKFCQLGCEELEAVSGEWVHALVRLVADCVGTARFRRQIWKEGFTGMQLLTFKAGGALRILALKTSAGVIDAVMAGEALGVTVPSTIDGAIKWRHG